MIQLQSVGLRRGTQLLLENANLTLQPGYRLGLVGRNGTGKSSLLALIEGTLAPDDGEIERAGGQRLATVAQEIEDIEVSAIEHVLSGDSEWDALNTQIQAAEAAEDGMALATLYHDFSTIDGFSARARGARLLDGLGFAPDSIDRPVRSFSGGWRMRINLARALLAPSDILLLDEPTNHLDLEMRQALTMALQNFEGAIVVVSHDRHLLRNTVDEFWLVNDGRVAEYEGDLEDYERWLADRRKDETEAPKRTSAGRVAAAENTEAVGESADDRKARKRAEAALRQKLSPYRKQQTALEKEMDQLQQKLSVLEEELANPGLYDDSGKVRLKELLGDQASATARLEKVEAQWLEVSEAVESLEAELAAG